MANFMRQDEIDDLRDEDEFTPEWAQKPFIRQIYNLVYRGFSSKPVYQERKEQTFDRIEAFTDDDTEKKSLDSITKVSRGVLPVV